MKLRIADDLLLPIEAATEKFAFLGRTGSGKTYAAMKLAELMMEAGAQMVALDPVGIWYGLRIGGNWSVYIFGGLHGDFPLSPAIGALIADLIVDRGICAVLDVSQFIRSEQIRFANDFIIRFYERKKAAPAAVHLFIEECQEFVPQNCMGEEAKMLHNFERAWKIGRNFGIGGSLISQRPQEINKKALNQAGTLFTFQMTGPQERKAVKGWVADKGIAEDIGSLLPRLHVGQPHVWSPTFLNVSKTVKILPKQSADVSTTPKVGTRTQERPLTPIDLKQLETAMASTIEKAKADDPRELRKQIVDLQRKVKDLEARKPEASKPIEVSILTEEDRKLLAGLSGLLGQDLRSVTEVAAQASRLCEKITTVQASHVRPLALSNPSHGTTRQIAPQFRVQRNHESPKRVSVATPAGELPQGELKILTVCGQYPDGATREQLTILTGYKRSSRDAYIQRLSQREMVSVESDRVVITDAGIATLGPDFEPLPTGVELQNYWLNRLPAGERAILEILVGAIGEPLDRERLTEATGYKRSSRDAYLQRLNSRQLVVNVGRGMVRASDILFS